MKLIKEQIEDVQYLTEEQDGKKSLFIQGTYAQGGVGNRNKRFYPVPVLEQEFGRYSKESIQTNRAMGELGHPDGPGINLDRACILIKEVKQDGNNFIGKAKVTSTPCGQIVSGLISDGVQLGVSTRALGTLRMRDDGLNEVQNDLRLIAVDVVADPSGPDCWVNGILENVDWLYDEKLGWKALEHAEECKAKLKKMSIGEIESKKLQMFESFLRTL